MNPCTLTTADQPHCTRPSPLEIADVTSQRAWGCLGHALRALRAVDGARIVRDLRKEGEQA
ncbi:hypothetical protein [Micromonospora sp. NPDC051296]|uniref:hypothetical protein n=1 Tax=Micromonospora sp. NPDC051296 TaxID=3155046 RepID=UPI00343214C1